MSCSVAAEQILFEKGGIQFEWVDETVDLDDFYVIAPEFTNLEEKEHLEKNLSPKG